MVTEDSIPFNDLNAANMRTIIYPICKGLTLSDGKKLTLNAHNCKKNYVLVADNIKKNITNQVKNQLLSLKIISATRLSRNIFGISAQFIMTGQIKSIILGIKRRKLKHLHLK